MSTRGHLNSAISHLKITEPAQLSITYNYISNISNNSTHRSQVMSLIEKYVKLYIPRYILLIEKSGIFVEHTGTCSLFNRGR
jgi:hypothetical protein